MGEGAREVTEPKPRRDGKCVVCKKERKITPQPSVPVEVYLADPFCSSECARKFYGTSLPTAASGGKKHRGFGPINVRKQRTKYD